MEFMEGMRESGVVPEFAKGRVIEVVENTMWAAKVPNVAVTVERFGMVLVHNFLNMEDAEAFIEIVKRVRRHRDEK